MLWPAIIRGSGKHFAAIRCRDEATQAGGTNYLPAASVDESFDVAAASQTLTWAAPAPIVYGTPMSSAQLDATVSVVGPAPAGVLNYSPAAGTILHAGQGQVLSVTAAATNDYNAASASVVITSK